MNIKRVSTAFAGGALGGLANALAVWGLGDLGVTMALGVAIVPSLTPAFIYHRVVWGGLWGFAFLLKLRGTWVRQGLVMSIAPTLVQLLVVFPRNGQGYFGIEVGALTPLFVVLFNAVWGLVAAWWMRRAGE